MLQSLCFPTAVSLVALTLAAYSGRLCQDSHHSTATKPPSAVCLHPRLSQQLSITTFPGLTSFSALLLSPPSPLLAVLFSPVFPAAAAPVSVSARRLCLPSVVNRSHWRSI